ncbi:hypothetical protein BC831DRAFT_151989 [Entophlyctis helioformis]|nr:hypothetical protein BC831DRAFT_151989 [Entophlyctis helioformis]
MVARIASDMPQPAASLADQTRIATGCDSVQQDQTGSILLAWSQACRPSSSTHPSPSHDSFIVKYGLKVALMPESMMKQKQHSSTVQRHNKKHNSGSMAQHTSDRQQDTMAMLDEPESKKVKTVKTAQMDHDLMLAACKRRREDDDDDSEADTPPPAKRQQSDARASIRDDSIPMPQPRSILPKPAGKRTMPTVGRLESACPTNASTSGRLVFSPLCH